MQDSEFARLMMNARSSNPMVRDDAIFKLGSSGDQRAVPILVEILNKSESALTKAEAMRAIAKLTGEADPFSKEAPKTQNNSASTKGGCFIATAAFGSGFEPQVQTLRNFRDNNLSASRSGRAFIRLYEWLGPYLACAVRHSWALRVLVRRGLIHIARYIEQRKKEKPYEPV